MKTVFSNVVMLVAALLFNQMVCAASFSGLENKELVTVHDVETEVGALLGHYLGDGKELKGRIQKVLVVEDTERKLVVKVFYEGFVGGKLWGQVRDRDNKLQNEISGSPLILNDSDGYVQLIFTLDDRLPEGTQVESAFLRLNVGHRDKSTPGVMQSFQLPKRWQVDILPQNRVVKIVPQAIGTARKLQEKTPKIVLPPVRVLSLTRVQALKPPKSTSSSRTSNQTTEAAKPVTSTSRKRAADTTPHETTPVRTRVVVNPRTVTLAKPAAIPEAQRHVMTKTQPALQALTVNPKLMMVDRFAYGVKKEDQDRGARGPSLHQVELLEGVRTDVELKRNDIMNLFPVVYQDQNPQSGVFYYLPGSYNLEWDGDNGFGMRMLYSATAEGSETGEVLMAMRIDSGVDTQDVQFAKSLLTAYKARHSEVIFQELRPLPIDSPPQVSLSGDLQHQYNIPSEKIVINAISDLLGQMDLSLVTDPVTKENLQLALVEDVGINGKLVLNPAGGVLMPQEVPLQVKLADARTFGQIQWQRGKQWENRMPYPVRFKYIHALLLENNEPIIYSWDLGNAEVPSLAKVEFDAHRIPSWLDGKAKRLWVDYSVVQSCDECDQQVVASITGGVDSMTTSDITFRTLSPISDVGAYEITITARSKYFHPRNRELKQKPILVLREDDKTYTMGPVYIVNRQPGESVPGDPLFEYQLQIIMADGTLHGSDKWIPSDQLYLPIGAAQIREALGFLPGEQ